MSFWKGFAQALKDSDEKKFKEKTIREEREYQTEVREGDRAFQRELFASELAARRADSTTAHQRALALQEHQSNLAITRDIAGSLGFGGAVPTKKTGSGGSSGGSSEGTAGLLRKLSRYNIDPELIGELSDSPEAMSAVVEKMEELEKSFSEAGSVFDPQYQEQVVMDVVNTRRDREEVSREEIEEVFERYRPYLGGADLEDTVGGTEITWEDLIAGKLSQGEVTPIFDFTATPMDSEEVDRAIKQMSTEAEGFINSQLGTARRTMGQLSEKSQSGEDVSQQQAIVQSKIDELTALSKAVESGDFSGLYESEYIGELLHRMKARDVRFDPKRIDPNLPDVFLTEGEAQVALEAGKVKPGDTIVIEGTVVTIQPNEGEIVDDLSLGTPRTKGVGEDAGMALTAPEDISAPEFDFAPSDVTQKIPGSLFTYEEWLKMSRKEREAAGLPVSTIGGEWHFRNDK